MLSMQQCWARTAADLMTLAERVCTQTYIPALLQQAAWTQSEVPTNVYSYNQGTADPLRMLLMHETTCMLLKSPRMYGSMFCDSGRSALNLDTLCPLSHLYIFWIFRVPPGASLYRRSLCRFVEENFS